MIETRALRYDYPAGPSLAFADVSVPQGGALLLQSPSGAGKSTWLALASGLLTPTAGRIVVAGQSVGELRGSERDAWRARTVGLLPQRLHLSEALSVQENLALVYYAAGRPVDKAAIRGALESLGVAALATRRPSSLSGGEAQRVALARAVLMQPRVLLADEPTASLDDAAASAAIALLGSAARAAGATLVIATHDARVRSALPSAAVHSLRDEAQPGAPA